MHNFMNLEYGLQKSVKKDKWGNLHIFCRFFISSLQHFLGLEVKLRVGNQNTHLDHLLILVESYSENVLLIKM